MWPSWTRAGLLDTESVYILETTLGSIHALIPICGWLMVLRSAVGITHSLRSDLWWTIPFHFGESLVNRLYSEIDQTYLSIEAQCVNHHYPRWTATGGSGDERQKFPFLETLNFWCNPWHHGVKLWASMPIEAKTGPWSQARREQVHKYAIAYLWASKKCLFVYLKSLNFNKNTGVSKLDLAVAQVTVVVTQGYIKDRSIPVFPFAICVPPLGMLGETLQGGVLHSPLPSKFGPLLPAPKVFLFFKLTLCAP